MNDTIVVIPHYNHSLTIFSVIQQLQVLNLPVLVVDDGSTEQHKIALLKLAEFSQVTVHYCSQNGGKGAAMKVGLQLAADMGYKYAVQVDADGQHQISDIEKLLSQSDLNPQALICGRPIYSNNAPKARLYGRKITDFWNMIHTHSLDIKDGMCGFRLYPLMQILPLLQSEKLGDRMDFDIEILVKAHWYQIPFIWVNTPVHYDEDGTSHFRAWRDNWLISKMHAKLFFGMVLRVLKGKKV